MITPFDVLIIVYGFGVVYHLPRSYKRMVLLTNCNPYELCDGCRAERMEIQLQGLQWEPLFGDFSGPFMAIVDALGWWIKPIIPAAQRAVGKEPRAKCSKGECLAWTSRKATA